MPTTQPNADERYVSPLDAFLGLGNGKDPTRISRRHDSNNIEASHERTSSLHRAVVQ